MLYTAETDGGNGVFALVHASRAVKTLKVVAISSGSVVRLSGGFFVVRLPASFSRQYNDLIGKRIELGEVVGFSSSGLEVGSEALVACSGVPVAPYGFC